MKNHKSTNSTLFRTVSAVIFSLMLISTIARASVPGSFIGDLFNTIKNILFDTSISTSSTTYTDPLAPDSTGGHDPSEDPPPPPKP